VTRTPTSTRTPGTPTIIPTPAPPGVYILPNHSQYTDSGGTVHVVGEVWNNTESYLRYVRITVSFYDREDHLVGTGDNYIQLKSLPPSYKTCFHVMPYVWAAWTTYRIDSPSYDTDGQPLPNVVVIDDSGTYNSALRQYEISGQVRNDHGTRVRYVRPVGTAYDGVGTVVGCGFTYANTSDLNPGQASAFMIAISGRSTYTDVTSYGIQVDGEAQ
jgi:hypothetical protein